MASEGAGNHVDTSANVAKNVAIVGASGHLGQHITRELLKTGRHNVTAITRPESTGTIAPGAKAVKVNYNDHNSLTNAMLGHDALIITMSNMAPSDSVSLLVEAALSAQIPYILPNEWGGDYKDPAVNKDTMLGASQLSIRSLIESKGHPRSSYIAIACGFWYDYSLPGETLTFGFDFTTRQANFYDEGTLKLHYSTLPYVGQAVARFLSLPVNPSSGPNSTPCLSQYRNSILRIHTLHLSQQDMLSSILRVTSTLKDSWTINHVSPRTRFEQGKEMLAAGDRMGWRLMLYARMFYPENRRVLNDEFVDGVLGLVGPEVDEVTRWALEAVEEERERDKAKVVVRE